MIMPEAVCSTYAPGNACGERKACFAPPRHQNVLTAGRIPNIGKNGLMTRG
jgi:hypothetical protein